GPTRTRTRLRGSPESTARPGTEPGRPPCARRPSPTLVLLSPPRPTALSERDPEGLEDCLEGVLRVRPFDQAHMNRQARSFRELVQERSDDIAPEAGDPSVAE